MFTEVDNDDDLMALFKFQAVAALKRRKMLFLDPFEVDEMEEEREKIKIFRVRKSEDRPMYQYSTWGRMLVNPRTRDPSDRKGGVLFRTRFRVPFPLFE